ncbi:sugar 3,4-ketoisomerase [Clostridium beijerinckii]|uniref:sugar 3,4-ketoisomerase n=1 Tax=Clostridium beijerinckii TaxID=1520 RepID=UPI0013617730|nr:FdtA/QdtA family cupin domain-containing protein [Clostridium beijerinckii]MZK49878.1 WxcM-like domain-containing protein [Clostridium beijerinckii]MZK57837.1 WxcM-like domain-containing protein [Clostridium beijerinckii]MZK68048.1 WxcM-like domain-containing protein [Clostridium beijerinckii]MZK73546.1 WxcM-like domain-containing protein [Clostridium beijerinckii]MZK83128.1 WxcM-like domain-containing protein [Clostridium beijerinckii]
MLNIGLIKFREIDDKYGSLVPIEGKVDIPFKIKRIYYIYNVENDICRGYHAHRKLHQILICIKGAVKIKVQSSNEEEIIQLKDPTIGLYIGPFIWREMFDFTKDAILLVLASEYYDENDYIRNYDFYLAEAQKLFK